MARPRKRNKPSDNATNARKRYYRQSERYLKQSEGKQGAARERLRTLAKNAFDKALSTYSTKTTQEPSAPMQRLADEFGIDINAMRKGFKGLTRQGRARKEAYRQELVDNYQANVSAFETKDPEELRQAEAWALFNTEGVSRRIMGAFVEVWKDEAAIGLDENGSMRYDREKMIQAVFKKLNADNMADFLEKIEKKIGKKLYKDLDDQNIYANVRMTIQKKFALV